MTIRIRTLSVFALLLCLLPLSAALAQGGEGQATEDDKTFYAVGVAVAQQLAVFSLTADELSQVEQGLRDAVAGRELKIDMQTYGPKIQALAQQRAAAAAAEEESKADAFVQAEAAKPGAVQYPSGLVMTELVAGTGPSPAATDTVTVHYHGTLRDGRVFDSSVDRGQPATFGLDRVIPCWTEGVAKMKVGGKARLVCPAPIAYGVQGRPPTIPGNSALVFEVELLDVDSRPASAEEPSE